MHTEDEAKTKWCPFARVAFQYRVQAPDAMIVPNRAENEAPIGTCIASECMAWRKKPRLSDGQPSLLGYCGLAGDGDA